MIIYRLLLLMLFLPVVCFGDVGFIGEESIGESGDTPVATWTDEPVFFYLVDGNAFVYIPGHDLSTYAGNDTNSTPYRIVIEDDNDDTVTGFLGAEGSGFAYGTEVLSSNRDFSLGDLTDWTDSAGDRWTIVANEAVYGGVTTSYLTQLKTAVLGVLYNYEAEIMAAPSGGVRLWFESEGWGNASLTSVGVHARLFTSQNTLDRLYGVYQTAGGTGMTMDNFSLKPITEGPVDYSLHVLSTANGTTRNWTTWDDGNFVEHQLYMEYNVYIYEN